MGPLFEHLLPNADIPAQMKVADFVDTNGCWKWSELKNLFSNEIKEFIAACHPPNDAFGDDICLGGRMIRVSSLLRLLIILLLSTTFCMMLMGGRKYGIISYLLELSMFYGL